jgi:hypothetical protein
MIFSIGDHIDQIIKGTKTQTRRPTDRYEVGKTYAIQPGRGKKGIPQGRIEILEKWEEWSKIPVDLVNRTDAYAEGGYTPEDYEALYEKMYPGWNVRYAFRFKFVPNEKEGMSDA